MEPISQIKAVVDDALERRIFKKIVFSRPADKSVLKTTGTIFSGEGGVYMQFETLHADGKATHRNIPADGCASECAGMSGYRQIDVITTAGSCTAMVSSSGAVHVKNAIKRGGETASVRAHDGEKTHILDKPSALPFLQYLGICGDDGRVFDRRRPKFRQINRFLEIVSDVYDKLPADGELTVCDLCCVRSYLTFAVYWYLTVERGRSVDMYGVDLKPDVIGFCSQGAGKLGFSGMTFICGDALAFTPPRAPDLVISLHACDVATDIVLSGAVKSGARVILSTPCCHHELFGQLKCPQLSFISDYPILKQKLCDAATDALRSKRLEMENYSVTAIELVDPDETPKNVLLRAIKRGSPLSDKRRGELRAEYNAAAELLGANPKLDILLGE